MNTPRAPHIELLLFLSLFAGFPVAAGNWKLVTDDNKTRVEIDITSLRLEQNGNIAKAWERETHSKPEQAQPGDFFFTSTKTLAQHHCAERTTTYLYRAYFAADGSEIKAVAAADLGKVDFLIPDSLNERKLIFACTYKPAAKKPAPLLIPPEQTDKAAEPPASTAKAAPGQPAEKDAQKAAPPAKTAAKDGKPPVEGKPEMAKKPQPETTKPLSPAPAGKTSAEK